MALTVATNVASMRAHARLSTSLADTRASAGHLASGRRIRRAADDAAGMTISQHLTSQVNGIAQAIANTADATAVANTADGGLGTVADALQRMRTLVLRAANTGATSPQGFSSITQEIGSLTQLLNAIAENLESHGKHLLDGSYRGVFQVGPRGGDTVMLDLTHADMHADNVGGSAARDGTDLTVMHLFQVDDQGIYTVQGVQGDLAALTEAITSAGRTRSQIAAAQQQLDTAADTMTTSHTALAASRSRLSDADLATQATAMMRSTVRSRAATMVLAQANAAPRAVVHLLATAPTGGHDAASGSGAGSGGSGRAGSSSGQAGSGVSHGGSASRGPATAASSTAASSTAASSTAASSTAAQDTPPAPDKPAASSTAAQDTSSARGTPSSGGPHAASVPGTASYLSSPATAPPGTGSA